MNNTNTTSNSEDDGSFDSPGQSVGNFGYGLGLSLGILVIFVILTYISYTCKRKHMSSRNNNNHVPTTDEDSSPITTICHRNGLDESTIKSYPQFEYSRVKRHKKEEPMASGCSICLGDYKDGDLLRLLPDCGHVFHVKCLDPWLSINRTCPICRKSPERTPPLVETAVSGGGDLSVISVQ